MKTIWNLVIIFVALVLLFNTAVAQPYSGERSGDYFSNLDKPGFSLLDPSRLSTSHSYSFSYFSGNGRSGSIGMLMNSVEYRISNPLKVTFNLGVLHNPSAFIGRSQSGISPVMIPGFQLQYRPSRNFLFQMNFQSFPTGYNGWYGHSGNYWDSRDF